MYVYTTHTTYPLGLAYVLTSCRYCTKRTYLLNASNVHRSGPTATFIQVYICTYACTYACTYVCTYGYMYVCTYACTYVCTYACMYVCTYIHLGDTNYAPYLQSWSTQRPVWRGQLSEGRQPCHNHSRDFPHIYTSGTC